MQCRFIHENRKTKKIIDANIRYLNRRRRCKKKKNV